MTEPTLFRKVLCKDRQPTESGMYITHVEIMADGLTYQPVSYNQWLSCDNRWTVPGACGTPGEVIDWLEPVPEPTEEEIEAKGRERFRNWYTEYDTGYAKNSFVQGYKQAIEDLKGGKQ